MYVRAALFYPGVRLQQENFIGRIGKPAQDRALVAFGHHERHDGKGYHGSHFDLIEAT